MRYMLDPNVAMGPIVVTASDDEIGRVSGISLDDWTQADVSP